VKNIAGVFILFENKYMTKIGFSARRLRAVHPYFCLRFCGGVFLALAGLAAGVARAQTTNLGATSLLVGPAAGTNSVALAVTPQTAPWTATANTNWLQLSMANQSGQGGTNVVFTFSANTNSTRSGTLTIAGQTVTVTQAGSAYVAAQPVTSLVSSGLNEPYSVALDALGNVYIADTYNNAIKKWSATNGMVSTLVATNLNHPIGVAVDVAGNVYIADTDNSAIKEWSAVNSSVTALVSSGLLYPYGVALDSAGNVYIADTYDNAIKKWSVSGRTVATLVSSGLSNPYGVAVDGAGNVYIADTKNSAIRRWSAATSNVTTLVSTGLSYPSGVAVDGSGNVYIADTYNSMIKEWSAASGGVTPLVSAGLFYPFGVAVDGLDNVYVADTLDNAIKELPYAFVDPAPRLENQAAGNDALPAVLPATENLLALFAPASDASWLTISGITNDVVNFSFTSNTTGASRVGGISLLGQSIGITQSAQPPTVLTLAATNITSSNATLSASVNPEDAATTVYFVFGTNTNYGSTNVLSDVGSGTAAISVSTNAAELLPDTVYHYEAMASNSAGLSLGGDMTFTTLAGAPLATTQPATAISYGKATLNALVNPEGVATTVYFVYGVTTNYGSTNVLSGLVSGTTALPVGDLVTELLANTLYHFEAIASNSFGTALGGDLTFSNSSASTYALGAISLVEGPAPGTNSVVLAVTPQLGAWTASTNATWLHLTAANQSGTGSANVVFSFDSNATNATRSNTLTIAGQTLTVIQAGSNYVPAQPVTTLVNTNLADPLGVAADSSGNVYFADAGSNSVKEWVAASDTMVTLVSAGLDQPWGVAVDGAGNVYIADSGNNAIKKWAAVGGGVTTLVSNLISPRGVAVDVAGNVYIANTEGNAILEWPAAGTNLLTLVSNGLAFPSGVAVDLAGNVYIADTDNNKIKEWSAANSNLMTLVSSNLNNPSAVAVDGSGNVYIADTGTNEIQEWTAANSNLVTLVSNGLAFPSGVAADGSGNVYFANTGSNTLEELPCAFVNTAPKSENDLATNDVLPPVLPATANLSGPFAPVSSTTATGSTNWLMITGVANGVVGFSITTDTGSNRMATITLLGQTIYVIQGGSSFSLGTYNLTEGPAAGSDSVVLAVNPNVGVWTTAAHAGWLHLGPAFQNGAGSTNIIFTYDANSGPTRQGTLAIAGQTLTVTQAGSTYVQAQPVITTLVSAGLSNPHGLAVDAGGNVYIADSGQGEVMEWMVANNTPSSLNTSGLSSPRGVAVDGAGNVYISDYVNNALYVWTPASQTNTTLLSAGLYNPFGVAVDGAGHVYIVNHGDDTIKEYSVANSNLTTLPFSGLLTPSAVAVDAAGNLYIADTGNNAIKMWTVANSNVTVLAAGLASPSAVAVDGSGNVYFADTGNNAIKKWTAATGLVTNLVPGLSNPAGVAVDGSGNVYLANTGGNTVAELPYAYVDTNTVYESEAKGSGELPAVLPTTENLLAPFAPVSSTNWLVISNVANGVVSFTFSNATSSGAAYITVLGQEVPVIQVMVGAPPVLTGVRMIANGVLQFAFTNYPNATFTVLSSTNLSLPLSEWTMVTNLLPNINGLFQFTSPPTTNDAQLFYVVHSP
jgi:sugar lactone lactonase YvrE